MNQLAEVLVAKGLPSSRTLPVPEGRENFRALTEGLARRLPVASVTDLTLPAEAGRGAIDLRIYRPHDRPAPTLIYMHGGGWVFGDLDTGDPIARELCVASGHVVVSVGYGQPPEVPFPGPLHDCLRAIQWAIDYATSFGSLGGSVRLAGDSAGANLAVAAALTLRDQGVSPIDQLLLFYPVLDPRLESESVVEFANDPFLSRDELVWYWGQYCPSGPSGYAAPSLVTDLSNLPPVSIVLAENDPLRDEGAAFSAAVARSGGKATLSCYAGMPHGFLAFSEYLEAARMAVREATADLVQRK